MSRIGLTVLVLVLACTLGRATEPDQARAILQRALHAIGEDRSDERALGAAWTAKVALHGLGDPIVYVGEWAVRSPERVRLRMTGTFHGRPFERLLVIQGDQGWIKQGGSIEALSRARLAEEKERLQAAWVATLLPLRAADYDLTPINKADADRKSVGLRVHQAGHRDVLLYFDESGRLMESQTRRKDPSTNVEKTETVRYSAYRSFGGIQRATRMEVRVDGKLLAEATITQYTRRAQLGEVLFQQPHP